MKSFTKVNFLDGVNGPKFRRRELGKFPPAEYYRPKEYEAREPGKSRQGWKFFIYSFLIILIIFITFSSKVIFSSSGLLDNLTKISPSGTLANIWGHFRKIVTPEDKLLKGEAEDRINILLLGQGGPGHEGAFLTDTIILASIKPSTNQAATLSIPRDLYVPIAGNNWRKINYANAYGEVERGGKGGEVAAETVSNILALPVHYYIRIDFEAFRQAINDLDGITLYVDQSFTDHLYPTENFGTTTITFNQGWQKMAGETALKYVRSRHGDQGEGSDFARSERQQKLILALKNKLFSFSSLLQPHKIVNVLNDFKEHLTTDLEIWEIIRLAKLLRTLELENSITKVLDDSPGGQLIPNIAEDGAYVLKTKTGDFNELANIAQYIFAEEKPLAKEEPTVDEQTEEPEIVAQTEGAVSDIAKDKIQESMTSIPEKTTTTSTPPVPIKRTKITMLNGTWKTGLAQKIADKLKNLDYEITAIGNAPTHDYTKTIIYDLTFGTEPQDLEFLLEMFNGEVKHSLPDSLKTRENEPDFLIILGLDNVGEKKDDG